MKLLLMYFEYPTDYQGYLMKVMEKLNKQMGAKTLTIKKHQLADFSIKIDGFQDLFQKALVKLGLSKHRDLPMKYAANFDIVHIQHSFLFPRAFRFPEGKKPKIALTLRGKDTYLKPWHSKKWANFFLEDNSVIDKFVVVSNHQKKYLHTNWKIANERIEVIPISVVLPDVFPQKKLVKIEIKIMSAIRLIWEKNIKGCLIVISELKRKGYKVKYTICGDGPLIDQLYFFINKFDLKEEVSILGKVNEDEYIKILKENNFYLQLSDSEALSASSLEAQYAGLPAILSSSGGLPETVIHEKSGYVIEDGEYIIAANKIIELFQNEELYDSFSSAAKENVKSKFLLKHELERLQQLYERMFATLKCKNQLVNAKHNQSNKNNPPNGEGIASWRE